MQRDESSAAQDRGLPPCPGEWHIWRTEKCGCVECRRCGKRLACEVDWEVVDDLTGDGWHLEEAIRCATPRERHTKSYFQGKRK